MKRKTSITLTDAAFHRIGRRAGRFRSRSEFIEAAVQHFIAYLERKEAEERDLEIINRSADKLNREAQDVLDYQVPA